MADVKISELAKTVGVSVDKLLSQIKEAGLPHAKSDELISNDDKNTLLVFLRRSHGDREATGGAPKKITLKRKTVGTLKSASTHGRGKTVNVEVRKKRTYVKRAAVESPELDLQPSEVEAAVPLEEELETQNVKESVDEVKAKELDQQEEERAPSLEVVPLANNDTPEALQTEADGAKAGKHAPKRKATVREDADDPIDKKKSHLRKKAKSQASKRQNKTIHVNDDFVLEGDDFDEMGSRGRRGSNRKTKARLSAQQHAFEKPTEFISREIIIGETNSLAELAQQQVAAK
jgi:translation initiation factor IF-2